MQEDTPAAASSDSPGETPGGPLPQDLLDVLVCPVGKTPLKQDGSALVCRCGLRYAIVEGIPNMLAEEATLPEGIASLEDVKCPPPGE